MDAAIEIDVVARTSSAPEAAPPASGVALRDSGGSRRAVLRSSAEAGRGRVLRYRADRRAVAWTGFMFSAHALVFFAASPLVAALCVLPLAIGSFFVAPINHHHQHLNTFHAAWLNRLYDLVLALQTGVAPYGWVLHHNLGHHVHYLNQRPHAEPDESRWTRRDGSQMGRVEYTLDLLLHHQLDILRVGRRHPRYLRAFLWMKLPLWTLLALAFWWNPVNAFLAILLPGWITLAHTAWATYEHHAGLHADDHYEASVNILSPIYNYLTCNLGYHTAHHKRPGVHWSLLPALHAEIEHRIPPEQIQPTFW